MPDAGPAPTDGGAGADPAGAGDAPDLGVGADGGGAGDGGARAAAVRAVEAVWRIEAARVVAGLPRATRDVGLAEDLAQDALVAALEQWPATGVPANPGAWLTTVARRRLVDGVRRGVTGDRLLAEVGRTRAAADRPFDALELDRHVEDDVLRLLFTACDPVLPAAARVALTLRAVAGLTTEEIARAYLVPVPTLAARITRAKKALAGRPFEVPVGDELDARLGSVLEVVYLIFNEGYAATAGADWARPALCAEAMRLGRMLTALSPDSAEACGLLALMEVQASRLRARQGPGGEPVTLLDQDRGRWDRLLIAHALAALDRARALGGRGPYVLQAEIAACHARAARAADTDWAAIAALYGELGAVRPSPVVELNRAVAVSMAEGPEAGLAVLAPLAEPLAAYHLLWAARGDLLARAGRRAEAAEQFTRAAALTRNETERAMLLRRAADTG